MPLSVLRSNKSAFISKSPFNVHFIRTVCLSLLARAHCIIIGESRRLLKEESFMLKETFLLLGASIHEQAYAKAASSGVRVV